MEIAIAAFSLTTIAVRANSKLWTLSSEWRDAPTELHRLRDDVAGAERFFREIQQHINEPIPAGLLSGDTSRLITESPSTEPSKINLELKRLVNQGACTLRRIEEIADVLITAANSDDAAPPMEKMLDMGKRRKLRWLRQLGKVAKLRKELSYTRSSICQILMSQNVFISANLSASLELSQRQVLSQMSSLSTSIQASHARIEGRMKTIEEGVLFLGLRGDRHDHLVIEQTSPEHTRSDGGIQNLFAGQNTNMPSRRESPCDITCRCSCHRVTRRARNMGLLRSMIGFVVVDYTSWISGLCTNPSCRDVGRGRVVRDVYLTYHLPDWLSRCSILAFFSNNLSGSPQMTLRVYHRRELDHLGVKTLIKLGDVEAVKSYLRKGLLSIYDLLGEERYPIIYLAFLLEGARGNGYEITKVLLRAGADPFQTLENQTQGTCLASSVFERSLGQPESCRELTGLIPLQRYIEASDFTLLHLAVMGVLHVDLAEMLQDPDHLATIDVRVGTGLTPLHLAAIRGNHHAAKLLVRAGANLESQTSQGRAPLLHAVRYNHLEVARVLLSAGADINSSNPDSFTPLQVAMFYGSVNAVRFLLERGAEIHSRYEGDFDPLFAAVVSTSRAKVKLVLQYGADIAAIWDRRKCNVLHVLARYGDVDMMGLFTGRVFQGVISTSLEDCDGMTPLDVLDDRGPSSEIREAFDLLLDSVESQSRLNVSVSGDADGCASDEEMEFFDAEDGVDGEDN